MAEENEIVEEKEIAVQQNIKYEDKNGEWAWATPLIIYKDGSIKLNGMSEEIEIPNNSITSPKLYSYDTTDTDRKAGNLTEAWYNYHDKNNKRPVSTGTIQDRAVTAEQIANETITSEKIAPKAIKAGQLFITIDSWNNWTPDTVDPRPVVGDAIQTGTIPLKKLSEPIAMVLPTGEGINNTDYRLVLYSNSNVKQKESIQKTWDWWWNGKNIYTASTSEN